MKKQDLIIIAVLFALLMGWPFLYKKFVGPKVAAPVTARQEPTNQLSASSSAAPASARPEAGKEKQISSVWLQKEQPLADFTGQ